MNANGEAMTSLVKARQEGSTLTTSTSMKYLSRLLATRTSGAYSLRRLGQDLGINGVVVKGVRLMLWCSRWQLEWPREWLSKCKEANLLGAEILSLSSIPLEGQGCSFNHSRLDLKEDLRDNSHSKKWKVMLNLREMVKDKSHRKPIRVTSKIPIRFSSPRPDNNSGSIRTSRWMRLA